MKRFFTSLIAFAVSTVISFAQTDHETQNVILITYDGLRWQEVFKGAEKRLLIDDSLSVVNEINYSERHKLLPFLWGTISQKGQIYGNRDYNNKVNVSNNFWFSYPGYNEILTGIKKDRKIFSNRKVYNPNITVFEYLNSSAAFQNKVAAFGSWELFPFIFNDQRCGFMVNAGNQPINHAHLNAREIELNKLLSNSKSPWACIRPDTLTYRFALEYMKECTPNVVFISFGETDEYGHDGNYSGYLAAIKRTDQYIENIWNFVQSNEHYRDKTSIIITTDHGRGYLFRNSWKRHGRCFLGSDQTWCAVMGPETYPTGEVKTSGQLHSNQLASTIATLLKTNYNLYSNIGKPIIQIVSKETPEILTGFVE